MARSKPAAVEGSISGTDFLQLSIADAPPGRRSAWLADRLRAAIADGLLPLGSRLPASRVLAAELRVSRGVVTEAYQRLVEDGHVEGRGRAGTVVVAAPAVAASGFAPGFAAPGFAASGFAAPGFPLERDPTGSPSAATEAPGAGTAMPGAGTVATPGPTGTAGADAPVVPGTAGAGATSSGMAGASLASAGAQDPASPHTATPGAARGGSASATTASPGTAGARSAGARATAVVGGVRASAAKPGMTGASEAGQNATGQGAAVVAPGATDQSPVGQSAAVVAPGATDQSATVVAPGATDQNAAVVESGAAGGGRPSRVGTAGAAGGAGALFGSVPDGDVFDNLRAAPARIDLSPGVPDLAAFPRAAWLRAERDVLGSLSAAELGYGDPRGALALRQAVVHWLARNRGIRASADEVVITAGVSQALGLLTRVLAVSAIAVEEPGSLGTRQHLRNWGVETPPVRVDERGLVVSEIGAAAVLVTPAHQFPTGVVLGGERRRELLDWAARGGIVIEDDYDAEHRYDRAPVAALRAMLGSVCYAGSVSKLLAPALRIGWLLVPPKYFRAVVAAKRDADLGNGVLAQFVLARLMESGALEQQLRFLRSRHRRRRDAMIAALGRSLPGAVVHGAAAGLHLMVTFGGSISDTAVAREALARGVKVQPLSWHRQFGGEPGLVLGYAARGAAEIADGVAVVGDVVRGLSRRGPAGR